MVWATNKKISSHLVTAAAASAVGGGSAVKSPPAAPSASGTSPSPSVVTSDQITRKAAAGVCMCNSNKHKFEHCHQYMIAGYVIEYDPAKAKEKWNATSSSSPKKKKAKNQSASESTSASVSSQPASSGSAPVGGAAHASANWYVALDSDDSDEGDMARDMGVVALYASAARKSNSTSALYPPDSSTSHHPLGMNSVCIGTSSHVAASHATLSSVVIADSGATDHMWPDYTTFTSYRPLTSKHIKTEILKYILWALAAL